VLAFLLAGGCAGPRAEDGPVARSILLHADRPEVERVGRLDWLGGLALGLPSPDFGGLSGLVVAPDGRALTAVTDRAHWFEARIERDGGGRLAGLGEPRLSPLLDLRGRPLGTANHMGDAEALARMPDNSLLVAFERRHRLWSYRGQPPRPHPLPVPDGLRAAPFNGALEAIAALPDGRLLLLAEKLSNGAGDRVGWLGLPGQWAQVTWAATGAFDPSDMTVAPDGRIYVLERRFSFIGGFGARISRLDPAALRPGARLVGEEVALLERPYVTENFEGIAAARDDDGSTLLYLVSDDNFHPLQRTLLLLFRVAG